MKQVLTVLVFLLMSIGVWAGEVVIVKNGHNVAVKKSAKERSKTTSRFIGYFLKRYCQLCNLEAIEWMGDEEFDLLCR